MFKRVLVILLSFFIVIGLFAFNNTPIFINYADEYEIYLTDFSCSNKIVSVNKYKYPFVFNVKGESAVVEKENFDLQSFLKELNAQLVFCESDQSYDCYYAYSPNIKKSKLINNKMVNLHIAITSQAVKVGSPIIYGSF